MVNVCDKIIAGSETHQARHQAHVRGVCALLQTGVSPIDLKTSVRVFQMGNSLLLKTPLVCNLHPSFNMCTCRSLRRALLI